MNFLHSFKSYNHNPLTLSMSKENLSYYELLRIQESYFDSESNDEYVKYPVIGKIRLKPGHNVFGDKSEYEIGKIVDFDKKTYFITNDRYEYNIEGKKRGSNTKIPLQFVEEIIMDWDEVK